MAADNRPGLCVMCDFCSNHTSKDVVQAGSIKVLNKINRTCGAGPTSNPDARCTNGKFKPRNTVIVFESPSTTNVGVEQDARII